MGQPGAVTGVRAEDWLRCRCRRPRERWSEREPDQGDRRLYPWIGRDQGRIASDQGRSARRELDHGGRRLYPSDQGGQQEGAATEGRSAAAKEKRSDQG